MEIGARIKELRKLRGIKQEDFAEGLGVSVQTVSRWENGVNYPDISMLPAIASFFRVTADYLLGLEGSDGMAKLLKTTEVFEFKTKEEAEAMVMKFKGEQFPVLKDHKLTEDGGKFILEVTKEFNTELDGMKFD